MIPTFDWLEQLILAEFPQNKAAKHKLLQLFETYKSPLTGDTQVNANSIAGGYLLTRGRTIIKLLQFIINRHSVFFRDVQSINDFGGGPGSFLWSLMLSSTSLDSEDQSLIQNSLKSYTNIEQSEAFLTVFKKIVECLQNENIMPFKAEYLKQDYLTNTTQLPTSELAVFSYTLNENANFPKLLARLAATTQKILIVEPGTPHGFQTVLQARSTLLKNGFLIYAPCTTAASCPLANKSNDWCHFVFRSERSKLQKHLKNAKLGYEDEKYTYLLMYKNTDPAKENLEPLSGQRIISRVTTAKHAVSFQVCAASEAQIIIPKKLDPSSYKAAKKMQRGDLYDSID